MSGLTQIPAVQKEDAIIPNERNDGEDEWMPIIHCQASGWMLLASVKKGEAPEGGERPNFAKLRVCARKGVSSTW